MMKFYKHSQIGYLIIIGNIIVVLGLIVLMLITNFNWPVIAVIILLSICLFIFSTLTVSIIDNSIELKFGVGLFSKKFKIDEIVSAKVVRNHWYYGWGIRYIPDGWLYNVSGLSAVEITLRNGKKYRIGTNEPEKLHEVIQARLKPVV